MRTEFWFILVATTVTTKTIFYYTGIRGQTLELLKSYLSNRTQYVRINNFISDSENITHGVSILFLIYKNGLLLI